ncbi:MAG: alpha/beta fold hydrolase [Rhodospirillales bacterium]
MKLESKFTNTRHGKVHYRAIGDGPPLILLHATPRSSRSFLSLMPHLATHHRVIAPDTLGFGDSGPLPKQVTIKILAEAMADVLNTLDIKPAAVFGLHTGNKIGVALTSIWPELVSRLIICGMTHSIILDRAAREAAIRSLVNSPFNKKNISKDEKNDRKQGAPSVEAIYAANYDFDLTHNLKSLNVLTMVLELATLEEACLGRQASKVAAKIPNARTHTFEGSDRDALEQRPQDIAKAILSFTHT